MEAKTERLNVIGDVPEAYSDILTAEALDFVATLAELFEGRRRELLKRREERQAAFDAGEMADFLPETAHIREGSWKVASAPHDLRDRRVEITGPVDRKMVINALNSGANVFMACFEDANAPTWANNIEGQINLRDAVNRTISYVSPEGKQYALKEKLATLAVRPRGWHLVEKHVQYDGEPISASLFDFGLFFFHNARTLIANGSGPYFYLPKMESHLEARLWNDVFNFAEDALGIPRGTIKVTVLIETIWAAFETEEILYELRERSAALNCGRWDYIFSFIKMFRNHPDVVLPDRASVTMTSPFMRAYSLHTVKTCHKRGAHAIGGMAAQIPVKNDPAANEVAFAKVREDKTREAKDGHDGTWVAHPGLVPVALEVFNAYMPKANQIDKQRDDVQVTAEQLLEVPQGDITEAGLRTNVRVGLQYIEAWFAGRGAVPIDNLMEDAATAEISRAQVWQWIRSPQGVLTDGRKVTAELFEQILQEERQKLSESYGSERESTIAAASDLLQKIVLDDEFVTFLTLPGYELLS
ncbi:malate synthase A [Numidum massiliense]|uniref:malate synthase A n=1 Tax=Numidum massiliense TaxID=1522315 RepID=UPI0006D534A5|nr:malate synthase A [Numidum massiliense]